MKLKKYHCRKVKFGSYEYRGYIITRHGWYSSDKSIVWEGVNQTTFEPEFRESTKKAIINLIDGKYRTQ